MVSSKVTFEQLRQLLLRMGFREVVVPDSHIGFRHDDSGTVIMLPPYAPGEAVAPHHLRSVRMSLDGRGLMAGHEFDDFLQTLSGKQTAAS
jgi:predicted RNA binding protein YcfA (HicA-like mRNA interferase family)